jgi:hypothetical protein|tara:strand:- start:1141 stop:1689 length:549 start_codon:yes stop_codon:yes gene_type:complete
MASTLGFSEIKSNQTLSKLKTNKQTLTGKKKITSAETEKLFKQLSPGDDDDDDLPNLLEPPKISSNDVLENDTPLRRTTHPASFGNTTMPQLSKSDNCVSTKEEFSNLQEPYVPYTTMVSSNDSSNNNQELMERINYMIYLLEEQKNEKTGSVHEEMVLYSFLGVFVIFIVDSFARAGKYSR